MKISVPTFLVIGIAAYLRQLELSVHRVASAKELTDFLRAKSIPPSIAIVALQELSQQLVPPSEADWRALAARSISPMHMMLRKIKSWSGESATVDLWDRELSASMEVLQFVDRLLQFDEADMDAIKNLRQRLHTCAELWQLHLVQPAIRSQIRRVEHLNPAQHLEILPLSAIAGPFLDSLCSENLKE